MTAYCSAADFSRSMTLTASARVLGVVRPAGLVVLVIEAVSVCARICWGYATGTRLILGRASVQNAAWTLALASPPQSYNSEHDLDQKRAGGRDPLGEAVVELFHRRDLRPGDPHRTRQPHPVEIGVAKIEHVERLAARVAGADIGELALEDRVAPVREQEGGDVEPFARLRPQGLQGVHAAAVAFEADDLAVGAGDRGTGCDRHAHADRAAHV